MKYRLLFFLTFLVLFQCAKQTSPTGGPKDQTPPELVDSNPANEKTNFKEPELELIFDEFIQLKTPREEIIITPFIGRKFEAIAKKNKVTLKFNHALQDSTTYSINFRESIQDITEKNPAKVKIAFSTGPLIDSLSISGTVKEILTGAPAVNYTVSLIHTSDTLNIFKQPATWLTLTNKDGSFVLENLKPGPYFLYAFNDKNRNLIVDSKSESYGFKTEPMHLTESLKSVSLTTQKLDAGKFKLLSSRPIFAYYDIRVSKSLVDYTIRATDTTKNILSKLEPDRTTVKIYNTIPDLDSLQIRFQATDSIQNTIDSLIFLKFNKEGSTKETMETKIQSSTIYESNSNYEAVISFSKPITTLNLDSIFLQVDSANHINFSNTDISWNKYLTELKLSKKIPLPKKLDSPIKSTTPQTNKHIKPSYELHLKKEFAISVDKDTAMQLTSATTIIKIEENAIVSVSIKSKETLIVQLLNSTYKLIQETSRPGITKFENIAPGNYMLRVIVDTNKNGKWDTGNFYKREPPEPIFYYTNAKGGKDFVVKANWYVGDLLISY